MDITINSKEDRPLLKRSEIAARIHFEGTTPARAQVADALAAKLGVKRELLVVKQIDTQFGEPAARVTAFCYTDADAMKIIEEKGMLDKNKPAAKEAPAADAAEEA